MKNMLFAVIAALLTSCSTGVIVSSSGRQWTPQTQQIMHQCSSGHGQKCYFYVTISKNGLTRLGQTVTFHHGGIYCHADGITEEIWYQLQAGYQITLLAYHY